MIYWLLSLSALNTFKLTFSYTSSFTEMEKEDLLRSLRQIYKIVHGSSELMPTISTGKEFFIKPAMLCFSPCLLCIYLFLVQYWADKAPDVYNSLFPQVHSRAVCQKIWNHWSLNSWLSRMDPQSGNLSWNVCIGFKNICLKLLQVCNYFIFETFNLNIFSSFSRKHNKEIMIKIYYIRVYFEASKYLYVYKFKKM